MPFLFTGNQTHSMKKLLISLLLSSLALTSTTVLAKTKADINGASFSKKLHLRGFKVSFQVTSKDNKLYITPFGMTRKDKYPIEVSIDGQVIDADIGDVNANGSPEVYVYVKNSQGSDVLIAYAANGTSSITPIYLPAMENEDTKLSKGYRGHEEIRMVENNIVRRFPIYKDTDTDDKPTGGMRQLQYKLTQGEAGWVLKLDKTVEY
jgi:hypothetical protein